MQPIKIIRFEVAQISTLQKSELYEPQLNKKKRCILRRGNIMIVCYVTY
jgi:hypothetical protein